MPDAPHKPAAQVLQGADAPRMRFLIQDASGKDLVDPVEVAIPAVLPLKIAKLYLPEVALKAVKAKLPDALKAMGFK